MAASVNQFADPTLTGTDHRPTSFLERVPVEEITADARAAKPGRALAALVGAIFIALAWLAGKMWRVVFMSVSYTLSSMKYGWRLSQGTLNRPSYEQLVARLEWVEAQAQRQGVDLS